MILQCEDVDSSSSCACHKPSPVCFITSLGEVSEVSCGAVVEEGDDTEELSDLFHPGEGERYLI